MNLLCCSAHRDSREVSGGSRHTSAESDEPLRVAYASHRRYRKRGGLRFVSRAHHICCSWASEFTAGIAHELLFKYGPQGLVPGFEGSHGFLYDVDPLG